ncbi:MAG: phage tail tape measure protein, partial [Acidaminococcaceae bacterium]|nr:phage tail tape measure protein [Acidaminococcaceae bacterium]
MAKEYEVGVEFSAKDNASEKIKKIQDTFMKCEKIIEKGQKMQAFGQRLGLTSAVIGSAAVSANNFISSMKEPYMEVEESLLALSTVTTTTMGGMDKSMEMTKQKAIAWSKAHRESANQYIQTAYQMASAGLNDVQAIAATETAMRTARATMGDSADAAALIAVAYNNMGDKTKDAASEIGKFGDVISKTQQLFQIKNLNQLSEGLKNAVPSALQFGQSFEELNVAIGVLNNAGVAGSVAGTAYAAAMRQMNKASKDLGITLARNSQGGIDFIGTLENINQKYGDFKNMAPEVQEKFKQAFGDEGLRTISLLASKTADMREKLKAVQNSKGTAETSQKTLESSEAAKLEIAANRLQAIKINFAERLMKSDAVIKEIIPKMGQLVEKIADMAAGFMNAHPEIAATIA